MPKGPKGEKRPANAIGAAVMVAKIATGEIEDENPDEGKNVHAVALGRLGGEKGGKARAEKMTPEQRRESARKAAQARWSKKGSKHQSSE